MNAWAEVCARANGALIRASTALAVGRPEQAAAEVERGRETVATLLRQLERAGADSPYPALPAEYAPRETPLQLLDTEANRRYARALRAAWEALQDVEKERGIEDGASEVLEDWLVAVDLEIHGPAAERAG